MNWNEFYRQIKAGTFAPVYLFDGPEEYVKREALDALREKLLPPGLEALNEVVMENVVARQIADAAETMPVMCERRVVVVRDWAPLLSAKSKNEEAEVEWMQAWLDNPPESCCTVFYMRSEADGRKKMTALLKKKAVNVRFELLSDAELSRWCAGRLKPRGKTITGPALSLMTYMAGRELTRLSGEVDKLADYLGDGRSQITEDDVRAVVPASLEYSVFRLMDSLLAGDVKKAEEMTRSLLQGGQTYIGLLATLTRQVRQLTHIKCALDAGKPVQTVQEALKLSPYGARQSAQQCRRLSADWLTALFDRCVEADFAVKSGRMRDQDALYSIMAHIALAGRRNP